MQKVKLKRTAVSRSAPRGHASSLICVLELLISTISPAPPEPRPVSLCSSVKIRHLVSHSLFVCVCVCGRACTFSLMDPLLPRSSRRPSPFLLQDAQPPPVQRRLRLQTAAAASVAARRDAAPDAPRPLPARPKVYACARTHLHTHTPARSCTSAWRAHESLFCKKHTST